MILNMDYNFVKNLSSEMERFNISKSDMAKKACIKEELIDKVLDPEVKDIYWVNACRSRIFDVLEKEKADEYNAGMSGVSVNQYRINNKLIRALVSMKQAKGYMQQQEDEVSDVDEIIFKIQAIIDSQK